jgi:hypothetical protein
MKFKDKKRGFGTPCPTCKGTGHVPWDCGCPKPKTCLCIDSALCPVCKGRTIVDKA